MKPTGELASTVLAGGIGSGSGSTSRGCGAEYGCVTNFATKLARYFRARFARLSLAWNCASYLICACRRRSHATCAAHRLQYRQRASHDRQSSSSPRQRRQRLGRRSTGRRRRRQPRTGPPTTGVRCTPRGARGVHTPPAPGRLGGTSSAPSTLGADAPTPLRPFPAPGQAGVPQHHDRPALSVIEGPRFWMIVSSQSDCRCARHGKT